MEIGVCFVQLLIHIAFKGFSHDCKLELLLLMSQCVEAVLEDISLVGLHDAQRDYIGRVIELAPLNVVPPGFKVVALRKDARLLSFQDS